MLEEVIENLIDNALKHGGPGLSRIHVAVRAEAGCAVLLVGDDGRGLPAEQLPVALQRFGQIDPSEGGGLGLAIVREIAVRHASELKFRSPDPGVEVSLWLAEADQRCPQG